MEVVELLFELDDLPCEWPCQLHPSTRARGHLGSVSLIVGIDSICWVKAEKTCIRLVVASWIFLHSTNNELVFDAYSWLLWLKSHHFLCLLHLLPSPPPTFHTTDVEGIGTVGFEAINNPNTVNETRYERPTYEQEN